jgi:competence protein ComEA
VKSPFFSIVVASIVVACGLASTPLFADLPDGAGKPELTRVCGKCHSVDQATSLHQSRSAWEDEISKMVGMGAQGTDEDFNAILGYLARNYGPEKPKPIDINTASAVDLESSLEFTKTEAAALLEYRTKNGNLKSIEDLEKIPGLDAKKIEAKKARITF